MIVVCSAVGEVVMPLCFGEVVNLRWVRSKTSTSGAVQAGARTIPTQRCPLRRGRKGVGNGDGGMAAADA